MESFWDSKIATAVIVTMSLYCFRQSQTPWPALRTRLTLCDYWFMNAITNKPNIARSR